MGSSPTGAIAFARLQRRSSVGEHRKTLWSQLRRSRFSSEHCASLPFSNQTQCRIALFPNFIGRMHCGTKTHSTAGTEYMNEV